MSYVGVSCRSVGVALVCVATCLTSRVVGTFVQIHASLVSPLFIRMHLSLHGDWLSTVAAAHGVLRGRACGKILLILHLLVLAWA